MKKAKNSWQQSVSTPSVSTTIILDPSKTQTVKTTKKSESLQVLSNEEFRQRRYSFDDNGGGYMGL